MYPMYIHLLTYLIQCNELILMHYYLKSMDYLDFFKFCLVPFFCLRIPCWVPHHTEESSLLRFFLAVTVCHTAFVFWWSWQFCVVMVNYLNLSNFFFFSWLDGFVVLWEEVLRDKVPFSSHHVKGTYYQHDLSL